MMYTDAYHHMHSTLMHPYMLHTHHMDTTHPYTHMKQDHTAHCHTTSTLTIHTCATLHHHAGSQSWPGPQEMAAEGECLGISAIREVHLQSEHSHPVSNSKRSPCSYVDSASISSRENSLKFLVRFTVAESQPLGLCAQESVARGSTCQS